MMFIVAPGAIIDIFSSSSSVRFLAATFTIPFFPNELLVRLKATVTVSFEFFKSSISTTFSALSVGR